MHPRAKTLIETLPLAPHPEGGHYRRIHESTVTVIRDGTERPALTAIAFLLAEGECSHWHRIDADECWHWQEGDALELRLFDESAEGVRCLWLGAGVQGECASVVVPAGTWQSARSLGGYTRVVCTVAPGFIWEGFELLDGTGETARRLHALEAGGEDAAVRLCTGG